MTGRIRATVRTGYKKILEGQELGPDLHLALSMSYKLEKPVRPVKLEVLFPFVSPECGTVSVQYMRKQCRNEGIKNKQKRTKYTSVSGNSRCAHSGTRE